jgi:hypothetical protein
MFIMTLLVGYTSIYCVSFRVQEINEERANFDVLGFPKECNTDNVIHKTICLFVKKHKMLGYFLRKRATFVKRNENKEHGIKRIERERKRIHGNSKIC